MQFKILMCGLGLLCSSISVYLWLIHQPGKNVVSYFCMWVSYNRKRNGRWCVLMFVFRVRRLISVWRWTALGAPATVALALVAAVEAGARVDHAATPHAATEDLPDILPAALAPAPGPIPALAPALAPRQAWPKSQSGNLHITQRILCIHQGSSRVSPMYAVMVCASFPNRHQPTCSFIFHSNFCRPVERAHDRVLLHYFFSSLKTCSASAVSSLIHLCTSLLLIVLVECWMFFASFAKILFFILFFFIFFPSFRRNTAVFLTFLCFSVQSSEEQDRMGTEETVHIRINRRRRSQMWHQWYDGCALSTVKL